MFLENHILIPDWSKKYSDVICGFSLPYYGNMALTRKSHSTGRTLKENRILLAETLKIDSKKIFSPHQIHSDIVIYVDDKNSGCGAHSIDDAIEGDACFTDRKNNLLLVTWADCIPVLLFESKKLIVAAIHSGWRGTKSKIVTKTIKNILDMGGDIKNIYAAVGPGIKDCCYKVGREVISYFNTDEYRDFIKEKNSNFYLDLQGVVYKELILAGIDKEKIDCYKNCNSCDKEIGFFSCRRDGKDNFEGQAAFIGIF